MIRIEISYPAIPRHLAKGVIELDGVAEIGFIHFNTLTRQTEIIHSIRCF